ncbi:MAG: hypothetical protein ACJAUZ_000989 [Flavobacteriaceae bacterium]|jgi:hypothetical protein
MIKYLSHGTLFHLFSAWFLGSYITEKTRNSHGSQS